MNRPAARGTDPADGLEARLGELLDEAGWAGRPDVGDPGGGAAAALAVALAAGLVGAAARRSGAVWDGARGASAQAQALLRRAQPLAGEDTRAYAAARRLLEGGGAETARDFELGRALERAAEVPLQIAALAADVAALAEEVAAHAEPAARADAASGAALAAGAARAAALLVRVNLGTTPDDARVAAARALVAAADLGAEAAAAAAD